MLVDGEREAVIRPRVRRVDDSGGSREVPLATYQAACDPQQLAASIVQSLASGVSTGEVKNVKPNSPGVGRSNVSRLWQEAGHKFVDQLREQDLSSETGLF